MLTERGKSTAGNKSSKKRGTKNKRKKERQASAIAEKVGRLRYVLPSLPLATTAMALYYVFQAKQRANPLLWVPDSLPSTDEEWELGVVGCGLLSL